MKISIIKKAYAHSLLKTEQMTKNEQSGEILNNTGTMEYNQVRSIIYSILFIFLFSIL